jgi:hypothetical protein
VNSLQIVNAHEFLPGLFWAASFTGSALMLMDGDYRSNHYIEYLIFCILLSITFLGYFYLLFSDPGFLIKDLDNEKQEYLKTIEDGLDYRICPTCHIRKPIRSKHCAETNKCIAKFDHYCPWLCNSIGVKNHRVFFIWMICVIMFGLMFEYYVFSVLSANTHPHLFSVTCIISLVIFLCGVALLYMFIVQVRGVILNETTNELVHKVFWNNNIYQNPFHKGYTGNVIEFFRSGMTQWDSLYTIDLEDVIMQK